MYVESLVRPLVPPHLADELTFEHTTPNETSLYSLVDGPPDALRHIIGKGGETIRAIRHLVGIVGFHERVRALFEVR